MEDPYQMNEKNIWTAWDQLGLVEDILARSTDDWMHVAEFSGNVAPRTGVASAEGLRALAIGLIAHLLVNELMVAGDIDEFGFHQWPGSPGDSIVRIVKSWDPQEPYPTPGSVAWLTPTAKGKQLGEAIFQSLEGEKE